MSGMEKIPWATYMNTNKTVFPLTCDQQSVEVSSEDNTVQNMEKHNETQTHPVSTCVE